MDVPALNAKLFNFRFGVILNVKRNATRDISQRNAIGIVKRIVRVYVLAIKILNTEGYQRVKSVTQNVIHFKED